MERTVAGDRWGLVRDLAALVLAAVACPAALFGGSMLGCVRAGFEPDCAMDAVFIAPVLLVGAGILAGLVTRGWTGLMVVYVGVVIGLATILVLSFGIGEPVPVEPVSGIIVMLWFSAPISIGYGIGRLALRLRSPGANKGPEQG